MINFCLIPSNLEPEAKSCAISIHCTTEPFMVRWCNEKDYPEKMIQVQRGRKLQIKKNGTYCVEIVTPNECVLTKFKVFHLNDFQPFLGGDGTKENPYLIENCMQFNQIRTDLGAHYRLVNDLNFKDALGQLCWIPIGQYSSKPPKIDPNIPLDDQNLSNIENFGFTGELDGAGHTIFGLNCQVRKKMWVGLFGSCGDGAHIHDLILNQFDINSLENPCVTGTIAGIVSDSVIERCIVQSTIVQSCHTAGGIAGYTVRSKFFQCEFRGRVKLDYSHLSRAGGIAGNAGVLGDAPSYYEDCCVKARISGADLASGIANGGAIISRCFFSGHLRGKLHISGITADGMLSIIHDCVCANCEIQYIGGEDASYQCGHFVTFCDETGHQTSAEYIEDAWKNHVGRIRCDDHLLTRDLDSKRNYCSTSCILRASSQIVDAISGSRRDGITISDESVADWTFYQKIGWDFNTVWEIGPNQFPQIKISLLGK